MKVWNAATGKRILHVDGIGIVETLALSPSGRVLTAGARKTGFQGQSCKVHLWETHSGQEIRSFDVPQAAIWALAIAPDGRTLAASNFIAAVPPASLTPMLPELVRNDSIFRRAAELKSSPTTHGARHRRRLLCDAYDPLS